ncbi:hypothetical protein Ahy_B07g086317 isoform B [Arachis hypogaea]|uniref:Uncharacterized protein n=1 Tax=Arachis hypogaea TaxID=3818 RepID=A0A444Y9G6_ARAHY|nr:hypothetical protein Ahy_B07g086317 isoform B [Arachis hypogaea]
MYIGNGKGNEHDREAGGFEETREPDAFSAVYEVEAHNEWAAGAYGTKQLTEAKGKICVAHR